MRSYFKCFNLITAFLLSGCANPKSNEEVRIPLPSDLLSEQFAIAQTSKPGCTSEKAQRQIFEHDDTYLEFDIILCENEKMKDYKYEIKSADGHIFKRVITTPNGTVLEDDIFAVYPYQSDDIGQAFAEILSNDMLEPSLCEIEETPYQRGLWTSSRTPGTSLDTKCSFLNQTSSDSVMFKAKDGILFMFNDLNMNRLGVDGNSFVYIKK